MRKPSHQKHKVSLLHRARVNGGGMTPVSLEQRPRIPCDFGALKLGAGSAKDEAPRLVHVGQQPLTCSAPFAGSDASTTSPVEMRRSMSSRSTQARSTACSALSAGRDYGGNSDRGESGPAVQFTSTLTTGPRYTLTFPRRSHASPIRPSPSSRTIVGSGTGALTGVGRAQGSTALDFDGIEGKVAIVTGSGGGIGETYAHGIAAQGARVVVAEVDKAKGERVAAEIRGTGAEALFVELRAREAAGAGAPQPRRAAPAGGPPRPGRKGPGGRARSLAGERDGAMIEADVMGAPDVREAIRSFMERRDPNFWTEEMIAGRGS